MIITNSRAIIIANEKIVPFQVFQAHCDEMSLRGANLALRSQEDGMDESRMKRFMSDQRKEIKKYKHKKEKEANKDLGDQPIYEWIESQSKEFRKKWEDRNR